MSIFDKGFDPLQEIQRATKAAGEETARIAEGASEAAAAAGAAVVDAATTAGAAVAVAAGGAKAALDEKEAERLDAKKAEYAPKVQEALRTIEGSRAQELLDSFQESPLPLTEANAAKVKSAFPIPREQTVVWADAEFDLRPSGIAMTEKGVYIKADADAFAVPGKEKRQSRLFYFEWAYFEPGPFASDGESNLAFTSTKRAGASSYPTARRSAALRMTAPPASTASLPRRTIRRSRPQQSRRRQPSTATGRSSSSNAPRSTTLRAMESLQRRRTTSSTASRATRPRFWGGTTRRTAPTEASTAF